jgi:hypothetical protein
VHPAAAAAAVGRVIGSAIKMAEYLGSSSVSSHGAQPLVAGTSSFTRCYC